MSKGRNASEKVGNHRFKVCMNKVVCNQYSRNSMFIWSDQDLWL